MGRPKKNVEKDIKKETKTKGRPKKVEPTLEERVKLLELEVDKLSKHQKDIDDDINEICDDFYCSCSRDEIEEDPVERFHRLCEEVGGKYIENNDYFRDYLLPTRTINVRIIRF